MNYPSKKTCKAKKWNRQDLALSLVNLELASVSGGVNRFHCSIHHSEITEVQE